MRFGLLLLIQFALTGISILLSSNNGNAQEHNWDIKEFNKNCSDWSLEKPGGPFEKYPVAEKGQRGVGICYAFSASKIFDSLRFYEQSQLNSYTSAYATSVFSTSLTHDQTGDNSIEGGSLCNAFNVLKKIGSCDQTKVDQLISTKDITYFIDKLKFFSKKYKQFENDQTKQNKIEIKLCKKLEKMALLDENLPSLSDIGTALAQSYVDDTQRILLEKSVCGQDSRYYLKNNYVCVDVGPEDLSSPVDAKHYVDSYIESSPQVPVGVSYCAEILCKYSWSSGINWEKSNIGFSPNADSAKCSQHNSVITGRRLNNRGKCEYLIHNSWEPEAICNPKVSNNMASSPWPDQDGKVWIEADKLFENVSEIQGIHY